MDLSYAIGERERSLSPNPHSTIWNDTVLMGEGVIEVMELMDSGKLDSLRV